MMPERQSRSWLLRYEFVVAVFTLLGAGLGLLADPTARHHHSTLFTLAIFGSLSCLLVAVLVIAHEIYCRSRES